MQTLFSQDQEVVVTGTDFSTLFGPGVGSLTLPPNFLTPGKILHFHVGGYYQSDFNVACFLAVASLNSINIAVSETFVTPQNAVPPANQQLSPIYPMFTIDGYITCVSTGQNGAVDTHAIITFTSGVFSAPTVVGMVGIRIPVDTTVPQTFSLIGQWSRTGEALQVLNAFLE